MIMTDEKRDSSTLGKKAEAIPEGVGQLWGD